MLPKSKERASYLRAGDAENMLHSEFSSFLASCCGEGWGNPEEDHCSRASKSYFIQLTSQGNKKEFVPQYDFFMVDILSYWFKFAAGKVV